MLNEALYKHSLTIIFQYPDPRYNKENSCGCSTEWILEKYKLLTSTLSVFTSQIETEQV